LTEIRRSSGPGRCPGAAHVVVPVGLHVLQGVLGEVGILVGEIAAEELAHDIVEPFHVDRSVAQNLDGVAQDVALDDVVSVVRQILREARVPKASEQRVSVAQARWARLLTHPEARRPRVAQHRLVGRDRDLTNSGLPIGLAGREDDLAPRCVHDAVQDVVLVGDVVVQRHRLDPELLGELAHAERFDPAFVGKSDGRAQHTLAAQGDPRLGRGAGFSGHRA
jgi:hypothetical protein